MTGMSERVHSLTAILPVNDMAAARAFFERLGFCDGEGDDQYYMMRDGKGGHIHLNPVVPGWLKPGSNPFGLYLYVEDVDAMAAKFAGEILGKVPAPEDKPWGMYEFAVNGPDETLVRIGWPTRLRKKASKTA